jgi:hypothetical protein
VTRHRRKSYKEQPESPTIGRMAAFMMVVRFYQVKNIGFVLKIDMHATIFGK